VCDRVAIVVGGRMRGEGPLGTLLSPRLLATEVVVRENGAGERVHMLEGAADVDRFLQEALLRGQHIISVTPRRESLEDLFVREAQR